MTGDAMMKEYSEHAGPPLVMRLWMLAQARANRYGHAAFMPSELKGLLGDPNGQKVRYAMRNLKQWGMIAKESTTLCVVLDCRAVRRDDGQNPECREPDHLHTANRMWIAGRGFEPAAGDWQQTLSDPERLAKARVKLTTGSEAALALEASESSAYVFTA